MDEHRTVVTNNTKSTMLEDKCKTAVLAGIQAKAYYIKSYMTICVRFTATRQKLACTFTAKRVYLGAGAAISI